MIQTPAFRNINIFFLIQTYGSYIYTVQKIILGPAGPRFITAMTGGGRWLQEGTQGEERGGQSGTLFSLSRSRSLSFSWGGGYTHILRKVEGLYIVLDTVHSTPPPIHGPSFSHSVAFSLDRHHTHTHTRSVTPFALSFIHAHSFYRSLPCSLPDLSTRLLFGYFFFHLLLFSLFSHLHSRAFTFVVFSYSATFKYRIFRNN